MTNIFNRNTGSFCYQKFRRKYFRKQSGTARRRQYLQQQQSAATATRYFMHMNQGNIFSNQNQQQQQGNMFNNNQNQQQQGGSIFNNNQNQQQQQQGGNIFSNQNTANTGGGMFNTQQNQQQRSNIFGNNQQTGNTNIFGNNQPQQGGNMFNNQQGQQTGNANIFSNQQGGNVFPNQQQGGNIIGGQQQQSMNTGFIPGGNSVDAIKYQIQQYNRKIDPRNLEYIRIDELNMFKDERIGNLDPQMKNSIGVLMNNMRQLRQYVDQIKKNNDQLDKKAAQYCKSVQQKLIKYKECLIQNVSQTNLLEQVKQQIELIQKQVNGFIIPLYNAHKTGRSCPFDSPDEFSSTIAKKLLEKMMELNNKVDQIISCQKNTQGQSNAQQQANSILVLEQLLSYYQNVAAKVLQFSNKYNLLKKSAIQRNRRSSASYEDTMRRIQNKVDAKMQKDFKSYDLIKQIQDILEKREKREKQDALNYERQRSIERKNANTLAMEGGRWRGF